MSASQDYVALDWIKGEIGQTLKQAQQALEMVAETPDDMASLRACLTAIHQVHGTLQMVELSGPTQVAEEMENLSQALMNSEVPDIGTAQEILMQSILQMPAYLDRIQREQQDMESNYLPIVNNLRIARGEEKIEGSEPLPAAGPNFALFSEPAADDVVEAYESANGPANLKKIRARYQQALVAALKRNNVRENLGVVGKVFTMLVRLCGDSPPGYTARLGAGCIEGITTGGIKLDNSVANQLRAFDKVLKQLIDDGAEGLKQAVPETLVMGFMEVLDRASDDTPKIAAAKAMFQSSAGIDAGNDEVTIGPDDETLAAVSGILREELNVVTDKLDLFVRSADRKSEDLVELLPMLEQISSTLVVVGMTQHQKTVSDQVDVVRAVDQDGLSLNDDQLMDMAGALLEVESSLGPMAGEDAGGDGDSFGDLNDAQAAVVRETRNVLAQCRDAVIDFVSSDFDHAKLTELPSQLTSLRGGLLIVSQERSGNVLTRASDYVTTLLADKKTPELDAMDDLADAITSIDYYLERLLESANDPYMQMIEVAEGAVEKLGFPVGEDVDLPIENEAAPQDVPQEPIEEDLIEEPLIEEPVPESSAQSDVEPASDSTIEPTTEPEETAEPAAEIVHTEPETIAAESAIVEPAIVEAESSPDSEDLIDGPSVDSIGEEDAETTEESDVVELPADEIDEDILPIFLEEAEELLEGIDESIQSWSEDPEGMDPFDNLLRHLHTLKGGSRMAGINSLGEFTHNFETFLIGLQTKPVPFDEAFFAALNQQQDEITRRVEVYQRLALGEASEEELSAMRFSQTVSTVATTVPQEPSVPTPLEDAEASGPVASIAVAVKLPADDVDADILPIFLEETEELLESIDTSIQNWSESTAETEHLDNLLRHLHTLKGGARMAGLNSLGEYAHNFETYLIGLQRDPVELNEQFFSMVNQRQDEMTRRVEIYNRLAAGEASEDELASLVSVTEPVAASPSTDLAQSVEDPVAAPAETAEPAATVTSQEMVRVSSDLLEDLISLAGESSITRGRIEQQISDFGDSLEEMEDTISRVRDQVRRLEIEAESRETLVSQQEGMGEEGFDELEMDRYTMLQEISRTLNEGTSDMLDLKDTLVDRSRDAELLLHQQARIASELQEGLTRTRMVPFARLIPRLRRIVRQVSAEIGKNVRFDAFNVEGELDRSVLDRIVAPLEHMLRNAVDHGIEAIEKRKQAGKPDQGRISLRLSREGGYVILTISDDGGGINVEAVRTKAIERGLITADSDVSDHEVMQFIMHAGFSTAQKLTQISGRGVGMDVVGSEIKALGGSMSIDSTLGVGSEFTISIPFTVSINRALMVVVREETYAVPLNTIEGIVRVSPYELEAYYQPDAPKFEYAGQPYRLEYMGKMLDKSENPNLDGLIAQLPVILARSGDNAVALQVDRVIGSREVVVKTLGSQFNEVGGISGATVLGDGRVVIILDVMALVRDYGEAQPGSLAVQEAEPEVIEKVRTVMIVDDSVTVRKVTSRLMERQRWEVITAKDGLDAVTQLQDIYPDVVLLDIEMPKMDGFEVLRRVRGDQRLQKLPIIMITSRTGEKHQEQALELGVNSFLGKPFQEASLISTIEEVISGAQ